MSLGLGSTLSKGGLATPGIVTSDLVLKHNYDAGGVVPVSDGACFFNGDDDDVSFTDITCDTDGNASFVFWSKRTAVSAEDVVLGHTSEAALKQIRFDSAGTLALESDTSTDTATITLNSVNSYEWHHYAVIVTSATVTAYQDGVSCSVANAGMSADTTINLMGGSGSDGDSKNYQGYLCNVGIWSVALTQSQIKSIMWKNYEGLTSTTGLVSWWNFSADANDSHGSNNGTLGA